MVLCGSFSATVLGLWEALFHIGHLCHVSLIVSPLKFPVIFFLGLFTSRLGTLGSIL